jgi:hypothetical protein
MSRVALEGKYFPDAVIEASKCIDHAMREDPFNQKIYPLEVFNGVFQTLAPGVTAIAVGRSNNFLDVYILLEFEGKIYQHDEVMNGKSRT